MASLDLLGERWPATQQGPQEARQVAKIGTRLPAKQHLKQRRQLRSRVPLGLAAGDAELIHEGSQGAVGVDRDVENLTDEKVVPRTRANDVKHVHEGVRE